MMSMASNIDPKASNNAGGTDPRFDAAKAPSLSLAEPGDFLALMKPRVMALVVFTAWAGLVIASSTSGTTALPLWSAIAAILCIAAGAGASGALNTAR